MLSQIQQTHDLEPQFAVSEPGPLLATEIGAEDFVALEIRFPMASLKRVADIIGACLLAVLAMPVMLVIAFLIMSGADRGPVLFRQERIGREGRPFTCVKFRSMCLNSELILSEMLARDEGVRIEWTNTHKLRNDPRVSPIGRLLRSTSLDELPQLWNVLTGDMSLVGPRPITQAEVAGPYTRFGGRQHYLAVRPGLTGLWQVSGRSAISYERRVELDKDYVRDMSLLRDARILWQTVWVVLRRDGAC